MTELTLGLITTRSTMKTFLSAQFFRAMGQVSSVIESAMYGINIMIKNVIHFESKSSVN